MLLFSDYKDIQSGYGNIGHIVGSVFGIFMCVFVISLVVGGNNRYRRWRSSHFSSVAVINVGPVANQSIRSSSRPFPGASIIFQYFEGRLTVTVNCTHNNYRLLLINYKSERGLYG